jgi:hypothetical protein
MEIVRTHIYDRKTVKLLTAEERFAAEDEIIKRPEKWPVISGTGGVRKARAARGSSGKSGGVRVMYYWWTDNEMLYFLDVYAKNEKENISAADKKLMKQMIASLKGDKHG